MFFAALIKFCASYIYRSHAENHSHENSRGVGVGSALRNRHLFDDQYLRTYFQSLLPSSSSGFYPFSPCSLALPPTLNKRTRAYNCFMQCHPSDQTTVLQRVMVSDRFLQIISDQIQFKEIMVCAITSPLHAHKSLSTRTHPFARPPKSLP